MDEAAPRNADSSLKHVEKGAADNPPLSERSPSNGCTRGVPVIVSGQLPSGSFTEETDTQVITPNGVLLTLVARVLPGQVLRLKNRLTRVEQGCRVLCVGQTPKDEPKLLAVEFLDSAQDFWSARRTLPNHFRFRPGFLIRGVVPEI